MAYLFQTLNSVMSLQLLPWIGKYFLRPVSVKLPSINKFLLLSSIVVFLVVYCAFELSSCSDRLSECYHSWRSVWRGSDQEAEDRERLIPQFASSDKFAVFPVRFQIGRTALLFFDRGSQQSRLIVDNAGNLFSPFLSLDSKRLIFVRYVFSTSDRELTSCSLATWHCQVLVQTQNAVSSPVEIEGNTVVYSSSLMENDYDRKHPYRRNDIYFKGSRQEPARLTESGYFRIDSIAASNERILYSAFNGNYRIYSIDISEISGQRATSILIPKSLENHFYFKEPTLDASISHDGQYVSFRQAETKPGGDYQYNLHVVTFDGTSLYVAKIEGIAGSRGIFVNNAVLFNELFSDRYKIKSLSLSNGETTTTAEIDHSISYLEGLDRIVLQIDR